MPKKKPISKLSWNELMEEIKAAQKDPEWVKEVKRFIKATT